MTLLLLASRRRLLETCWSDCGGDFKPSLLLHFRW
ncbi:unnamed protein product [Brassica rapa subsp. trilocularis]